MHVIGTNTVYKFLLPGVVCCCLRTCNFCFERLLSYLTGAHRRKCGRSKRRNLLCSLGFHAITFEHSDFTKIANLKSSQCSTESVISPFGLLHVVAENAVRDRQTH